jgi:ribonuclease HI
VLVAAIWALTEEPPFNELIIRTRSSFLVDGILDNLKKWEPTGYIDVDYKNLFHVLAARLRGRGAPTKFHRVGKSTEDVRPLNAQDLAQRGTKKDLVDEPDLSIDPRFNLTGAQLSLITQKLAYAGICDHKRAEWRRGTAQMLDITRHAIHQNFGPVHNDREIWLTIKNKDFNKPFRTFLWKALHKNHKVGSYWLHIDNFEHRSMCRNCETMEDLEHIILECNIPGRKTVWDITKNLWLKKHNTWPELKNVGDVLGCGLTNFKSADRKPSQGTNRLYRILISEAAHFIWKLRNDRLFKYQSEDDWPQQSEIHNRWLATINARLTLDRSVTHNKYGKRALKHRLILDTWDKTLKNEQDLPKNWIPTPGVLVDVAISEHQEEPALPDEPP